MQIIYVKNSREKWSDFFDINSTFIKKIVNLGMYTFIACLATFIAAFLVREYAPYSAGSGIPGNSNNLNLSKYKN